MSSENSTGVNPLAGTSAEVGHVDFDDVRTVMRNFGVELTMSDETTIAGANLNGIQATFAIIGGGVLLIRADVPTGTVPSAGDPTLFLAANQFNVYSYDVKAAVVDRTDELILRTESETLLAAGMTEPQLTAAIRSGVDGILGGQQVLSEITATLRGATEGWNTRQA
ncbi:YbjN domain-containing protein [Corynebacterium sp. CCM 9204]|uniref:YbjN domain-containing protein n=1 Tax=Corynebacterium sp. CCM 9204 TaxID=3057616 RepID=UPI003525FDA7